MIIQKIMSHPHGILSITLCSRQGSTKRAMRTKVVCEAIEIDDSKRGMIRPMSPVGVSIRTGLRRE